MKSTIDQLGIIALFAILCFGIALGVNAYLFAAVFAAEAAAALIWAAWLKK
jgi:hypothetical protein